VTTRQVCGHVCIVACKGHSLWVPLTQNSAPHKLISSDLHSPTKPQLVQPSNTLLSHSQLNNTSCMWTGRHSSQGIMQDLGHEGGETPQNAEYYTVRIILEGAQLDLEG